MNGQPAADRDDRATHSNLTCEAIMSDITVLSIEQACKELGLSEPTMRRRAADDPTFPRKIKLSARRVGYLRRDIEAYLAKQREAALAS
ncbi:helix-turn-helix transcriptional regulator [Qipengyuania citrea]|uniref:helix-turn-helix transcriptional regulator n=1 Tax=Qipengyuania citrea TaxID=225971 RepID=UPI0032997B0B